MALDLFVGRTGEQELYQEFLSRETPWVMVITGLVGCGKSRLLHRLSEQPLSNCLVVELDFTAETLQTDPLTLLRDLADLVKDSCSNPREFGEFRDTLERGRRKLLQRKSSRITQINQRISLGKDATLKDAKLNIGAAEDISRQDIHYDIYHHVREMVTEAFYALIDTFELDQLVIMLDTCEWLSEPAGLEVGRWLMEELVPGLHRRMRRKHRQCFFVMASRVEPQLDVIDEQDLLYLDLQMLDKDAVDEYLGKMGMENPEMRERVYEVTHGNTLCVSIIGNLWQKPGEKPSDFSVLQEKFNKLALKDFIDNRILKRLNWPFKELTRYGVLLRSFDLPLLQAVFHDLRSVQGKKLSEQEGLEWFDKLIHYPYIDELPKKQRWAFYELLRMILGEHIFAQEPEKWQNYHERALSKLSKEASHSPDWYYHTLAYCLIGDKNKNKSYWEQEAQGKAEYLHALNEAASDATLKHLLAALE